jgi:hypothetical protein
MVHYWLAPARQRIRSLADHPLPTPPYTVEWDTAEIPGEPGIWQYLPPADRGRPALVLAEDGELREIWVLEGSARIRQVYDADDFHRRLCRAIARRAARQRQAVSHV